MALFNMKDKWILYRKVGNALMCEERKYVTSAGVYGQEDSESAFRLFVENTENIISNEGDDWNQVVQSSRKNTKKFISMRKNKMVKCWMKKHSGDMSRAF